MGDNRDINFQSTERQKNLPEDSLVIGMERSTEELMVPLIASLYRKGDKYNDLR